MTKQEQLIKENWEKIIGKTNYKKLKKHIIKNGDMFWFNMPEELREKHIVGKIETECLFIAIGEWPPYIRIKSLDGIENNNGWVKVESETDVPKIGEYDMSSFELIYFPNKINATHYQLLPIQKPKPPIY